MTPEHADHYFNQLLEMFDNEYNRELYNEIIVTSLFAPTPQVRLKSAIEIIIEKFIPEIDGLLVLAQKNKEDPTPYRENLMNYHGFREQIFQLRQRLDQEAKR